MATSIPVVLLESEPATEWLCGGPVRKVSPKRTHAVLQGALVSVVRAWANGRGDVGTEWRFWLQPPGEEARYLVPDVAFVADRRSNRDTTDDSDDDDESRFAPDVAFEILSPGDRPALLAHKIDVYLRAGTRVVVVIDPAQRSMRAVDHDGERTYAIPDLFEHAALPGFSIDLARFFAEVRRR